MLFYIAGPVGSDDPMWLWVFIVMWTLMLGGPIMIVWLLHRKYKKWAPLHPDHWLTLSKAKIMCVCVGVVLICLLTTIFLIERDKLNHKAHKLRSNEYTNCLKDYPGTDSSKYNPCFYILDKPYREYWFK
jgi:hypothetical protein